MQAQGNQVWWYSASTSGSLLLLRLLWSLYTFPLGAQERNQEVLKGKYVTLVNNVCKNELFLWFQNLRLVLSICCCERISGFWFLKVKDIKRFVSDIYRIPNIYHILNKRQPNSFYLDSCLFYNNIYLGPEQSPQIWLLWFNHWTHTC